MRLWTADGQAAGQLKGGHDAIVISLAWSPDGRQLASGDNQGTVRLWERDGTLGPALGPHFGSVRSLAWHPNGRWLAAGSENNSVTLWDTETHQRKWVSVFSANFGKGYPALFPKGGAAVTFDPSGQILSGDPAVIEREFVCFMERPDGSMELLRPSQFARRVAQNLLAARRTA